MADLTVDMELLRQLKTDLDAVVREFQDADDFSKDVAAATGHDSLHKHVEEFASKWNDKRKSMTENVQALQSQVASIADGFTQVDAGLAKALEDAANSGPADYPNPHPASPTTRRNAI